MHLKRSLAALVAAAGLGGSALALVPSAAQAVVPAGADVYGTVLVGGAAAANVEVDLRGVAADGTTPLLGTAYTDASGQYWFDFDGDDASDGTNDSYDSRIGAIYDNAPVETQFKVGFFDDRTPVRGQLDWEHQYSGNQPTLKRAVPVNRAVGTPTVVPTAALLVDSGAQGAVTVPAPAGYYYYGTVVAYDSDQQTVATADFNSDPTDDATDPLDGVTSWEMRDLYPGGTYTFQFFAYALPVSGTTTPSTPEIDYIGSFYGDSTTFTDAKAVETKAGAFSTSINGILTNTLVAKVKPSIEGTVAPGEKVSADPGTWNLNAEARFTYQWLLNGKLVSVDDSYKLPKKAKKSVGKKLQLVVTNQVGNYAGTVALKPVKVKYDAKLKATVKPAYVGGKRVVKVNGALKLKGVKKKARAKVLKGVKVTVYEVSKTDDTVMVKKARAAVRNGIVSVSVKGLISGKHYLEVVVSGKKVAEITRTFRVKV